MLLRLVEHSVDVECKFEGLLEIKFSKRNQTFTGSPLKIHYELAVEGM